MTSRVRTSVVVIHIDKLLTFRAVDPVSGQQYNFLPGGKIESHETAPEAAVRETREETGYQIQIQESSCVDKEYIFRWAGEDYDCLTLFYRGQLKNSLQAVVDDAPYNKGVEWIPLENVKTVFNYSAEVLSAVEALL